jgi:hypothetical protein
VTVVGRWVRLYTVGLEEGARHDRRAEIDSDLWEHRNHAAAEGERVATTSLSIFGRWAAGIPADLSWRALQPRHSGSTKKETMMAPTFVRYWWQALAALTAVGTVFAGIRQFFTDEVSVGVNAGKVGALVFFVSAGVLTLVGLAIQPTNPRRGARMVMIGVLPAALIGGLGVGIVVGLVASLTGGLGWWWVPVGIASAVATAAGVGAFSVWWHAAPVSATNSQRIVVLPTALVVGGLVAAGAGVGLGWLTIPMVGFGAVIAFIGVGIWRRRITVG